ncbi:spore coat U domain-containing protein [Caballeronia sordidicola]|uniref:Csu type fimbrial protein n=1 Tax=Caballeronia sordidicola TaxID=196367 RepID=UPI00068E2B45|nr:spore coat U domain-containing protein [Caballeronia sordidicola]
MRRIVFLMLVVALALGVPERASAQSCTAVASAISFGSVSPISGAAVATTGSVSVTCTWPAITLVPNAQVCLNLGGTSPRSLTNGTNLLQYDLYQDAGHSLAWGSIYSGTTPISLTLVKPALGTSVTQAVPIYGQITANQPTVPTIGNASTLYNQTFGGSQTSINAGFYLLGAPTCASLTASEGTFPFSATATVVNNCNISATNLNFGATGLLSSALKATASITAQCTNGDAYQIALNGGTTANVAARQMTRSGGGGAVNYQLYVDSGLTTTWGDGTGGTTQATGTGTGNSQVLTVYGEVPAQTTPAPGIYTDTITATISF